MNVREHLAHLEDETPEEVGHELGAEEEKELEKGEWRMGMVGGRSEARERPRVGESTG
jgi:hypothetical protein